MSESVQCLRIAIVGPESCGKTTLAADLAAALQQHGVAAALVAEYARDYYASREYRPTPADVLAIARGQLAAEDALAATAPLLLCDSTALTCRIWAEVAFGEAEEALLQLNRPQDYALTLLAAPDIPWQYDPLRSHPAQREWLFGLYHAALEAAAVDYHVVGGNRQQRVAAVWPLLRVLLPQLPVF
ncbi:AAA family ATPase [Vogesella sp. LIG4]|uniref:AAA family ATPase n=1 Tax=Vogesella sp. LIG4 TaxID=1192162 RepID=UPI0008200F66|nr:ATP-binding protein [Vogesella sp. LIG4]SCK17874.1 Nicotinamide riboside kinase [Vogesella sp. LIG4]